MQVRSASPEQFYVEDSPVSILSDHEDDAANKDFCVRTGYGGCMLCAIAWKERSEAEPPAADAERPLPTPARAMFAYDVMLIGDSDVEDGVRIFVLWGCTVYPFIYIYTYESDALKIMAIYIYTHESDAFKPWLCRIHRSLPTPVPILQLLKRLGHTNLLLVFLAIHVALYR